MKITQTTADLPEETWKEFAQKFCGWLPKVMTTTESPNYEIDNPVTYLDAIRKKYHTPILRDIASFNVAEAEEDAKSQIHAIEAQLEQTKQSALLEAENIISFIIE